MKTAVVILNWNGKELLKQFLPSVISHSAEATIYVADNASTDDSVEFLRKSFPEVQIIQNETNGGYAKGYNDALRNLDEDIFILLNSDIEVTPGWLRPIIAIFEHEPKVGAVQPKILDYNNKAYFEYAGAAGGFIDKYAYPFCRGRIFDEIERDKGQYDQDETIFWASGACLAIQKEAFLATGGFDEDFFAHQEEIDLCWRLNNLNYIVRYASKSTIYHVGGATLSSINPMKTFFNFRNSLYLIVKNVPPHQVKIVLFNRMILDGIAAFRFITQRKFHHFFAVFRAHLSFYSSFSAMRKKRKNFPKKKQYFRIKSVVYTHYLRGRKKYSEI